MAAEMTVRHYSYVGADNLILAESKADMKLRTGGISPDLSDAEFIMVTLCVERLGLNAAFTPQQKQEQAKRSGSWRGFHRRRSAKLAAPMNLDSRRNVPANPEI